ncbi:PAS domain S-box protein [Spirosoma soli]|uniref:histidine kinase n=1 Tax=Spirosoma soli TaxID=1770529 RepID=A0ABW5M2M6_9BACT
MAGDHKSSESKPLTEHLDTDFALKAAKLGVWELDPVTNLINWNDRCRELFGLAKDNLLPYEQAITHIHPDDVNRVDQAVKWAMDSKSGGALDVTYRTIGTDNGVVRWVRCVGQGYFNTVGEVYRFAGIAQDVTQYVQRQQIEANERQFRAVVERFPVATALFSGPEFVITLANERVLEYWGRKREQVMNKPLFEALPEVSGQGFEELLTHVYTTGERFVAKELTVMLERNGQVERTYIDFVYEPFYGPDGTITGITVGCTEITEQVEARQKILESEIKFRTLIEEAPVATCLFVGRNLIIEVANDVMIGYWGKNRSVIGKPLAEAVPELQGQPFLQILDDVFTTGTTYKAKATPANLEVDGVLGTYYFDFTYKPLRNSTGEVYAIMDMAVDVTEEVLAKKKLEENEAYFRHLTDTVPAILWLTEPDGYCSYLNKQWYEYTGQTQAEAEGFGWLDATHPDDKEEAGRLFLSANEKQTSFSTLYRLRRKDGTYRWAIDTGNPRISTNGDYEGIIGTVIDVHDEIIARQELEEAEASLRQAVELAKLATWSMDIATGNFTYSERFMEWLGFSEATKTLDEAHNPLPDEHRQRVADAITTAIQPGSSGFYENEHPIVNRLTGQVRIIHAQGQVFYDTKGTPTVLKGIAQDITEQRNIQLALEQKVQQRTQELETVNEELGATNEELAATNEELAESNELLIRSNDNLQRFAYVASHDLQEPLRKIQSFGDLLKNQYADRLGEGVDNLVRMQSAASRMSILIKDLLSFSRISTQQDTVVPVSLTTVVNNVLLDLDLRIQETRAVVRVEPLPVIQGDPSQLGQLFQNLINNALKFSRAGLPPIIQIKTHQVSAAHLPVSVKPTRTAKVYHCISISDNGIGFDEKYVDRIFQVFQRLHGRNEFSGTGIGLAICEKVAANHGGAITATSQPGQGATFHVYLPA